MQIAIINPQVVIQDQINTTLLEKIERFGRVCYKSEKFITADSAVQFVRNLIKNGHESVIEHEKITVIYITNRGATHEIVRHRLASYSQESTRYCNYQNKITFIRPYYFAEESELYSVWKNTISSLARAYLDMLRLGARPEQARGILPNDLKSDIVVTYNLREWRHFLKLRCDKRAHPQIRQIAIPTLLAFQKEIPVIFDDIGYDAGFPESEYARVTYGRDVFS